VLVAPGLLALVKLPDSFSHFPGFPCPSLVNFLVNFSFIRTTPPRVNSSFLFRRDFRPLPCPLIPHRPLAVVPSPFCCCPFKLYFSLNCFSPKLGLCSASLVRLRQFSLPPFVNALTLPCPNAVPLYYSFPVSPPVRRKSGFERQSSRLDSAS